MAALPEPRPEPRAPLSRGRVLDAAVALADASGIGSLTMRRLAQELGVEAMTLYYYVANKHEILDGIVELVMGEVELPSAGDDWKPALRRLAISAHDVLTRHPWAAALTLSHAGLGLARLRYMDAILGTLRGAGFSAGMTDRGYHALESHIMGFTLWEVGMDLGTADELRTKATSFLGSLPVSEFPHLAEHVEQHLKPRDPADEGSFVFGLDLLLDGLERILDASNGRRGLDG